MIPLAPLLVSAALAQAPPCPDRLARLDLVDATEQSLLEANLDAADQRIRQLEKALACGGLVDSEVLGRLWLVEGAWLALSGDAEAAEESWRAAARVSPGRWVDAYGQVLRDQYDAAIDQPPAGQATLALDPPLFRWIGAIDGQVTDFPATVPAGLHLVQIGPDEDHVEFARVVMTFAGQQTVLQTGISEPSNFVAPAQPVTPSGRPVRKPKEPRPPAVVSLYTGFGVDLAVGREVTRGKQVEPGTKVLVPVETGFVIRPKKAWIRAAGFAGPLTNGVFLHDDSYGPTQSQVALGGSLAGGLVAQQGDIGLMAGYRWPDRIPLRAVVAVRMPRFPLQLEGRLGMNVLLEGAPEPAFELSFGLSPGLFR